ncbi:MAG: glycosyltransferase family 2 protein [Pirellulaceae bacterium]|nr:glycosyltransferase family 2 protein [Pirellulaceae bacterium]
MQKILTAIPVFNEARTLNEVLDAVVAVGTDVLVVNDGSTDQTAELLAARSDIQVIHHAKNSGYGAALLTAFQGAVQGNYDVIVTMDCDGQHEPQCILPISQRLQESEADIVSGSRYLDTAGQRGSAPIERRRINFEITQFLNARLGLSLTDAFCGFKAYRVSILPGFDLTETGYAMPLELWVQASRLGLKVIEYPVPLIYLDEKRSFGGQLDDGDTRMKYYLDVIEKSLNAPFARCSSNG